MAGVCARGVYRAVDKALVSMSGRKEIFAEKGVPIGKERDETVAGCRQLIDMRIIVGGNACRLANRTATYRLCNRNTADNLGDAAVADCAFVGARGKADACRGGKERTHSTFAETRLYIARGVVFATDEPHDECCIGGAEFHNTCGKWLMDIGS